MDAFESYLLKHRKDKRLEDLTKMIKNILTLFFRHCQTNPLIPFEIIFEWGDHHNWDKILSNYSSTFNKDEYEPDNDGDVNQIDETETSGWSELEDE